MSKRGAFAEGKLFIYSGEIHYFRVPRERWGIHLRRAREAGLNTVSSYIPWRCHEPEEGKFDFSGENYPERDLVSFIRMVAREGLRLAVRVGPVCNGEMVLAGLPDWLARDYPESMLLKRREIPVRAMDGTPSYLDATFLEKVGSWYERLIPILRDHQEDRGGCIVLAQLDNEIAMHHWLGKLVDESPHVTAGYRDFLKRKYGAVEKLNRAYGTEYRRFESIPPLPIDYDGCLLKYTDRAAFCRDYFAEYFRVLSSEARALGVTVPLVANIPHFFDYDVRGRGVFAPLTTCIFRDFSRKVKGVVFGGAYQPRRIDYNNFHDLFNTTAAVRMISDPDTPGICAEMQTGVLREWPRLYSSDVELNILCSTASGLNGLNAYMFSGGFNRKGLGSNGTHHEWQAPVKPDGGARRHFEIMKKYGRFFSGMGNRMARTRPVSTVQVGFYPQYWMTEFMRGPETASWESRRQKGFYDGICRLLTVLGIPYRMIDLEREQPDSAQPLFVYSAEYMDGRTQRKLADFVRNGGRMYLGPEMPERDLRWRRCNVLRKAFGLEGAAPAGKVFMTYGNGEEFLAEQAVVALPRAKDRVFFRDASGRAGALLRKAGRGKLVFCGYALSDRFHIFPPMFDKMARSLGARKPVQLSDPDVTAHLRKGRDASFLFLLNCHEYEVKTAVKVGRRHDLGKVTVPARGGLILPLDVKVGNGLRIVDCTLPVSSVDLSGKAARIGFADCTGRSGVLRLECPRFRKATVEGGKAQTRRTGSMRVLTLSVANGQAVLSIEMK